MKSNYLLAVAVALAMGLANAAAFAGAADYSFRAERRPNGRRAMTWWSPCVSPTSRAAKPVSDAVIVRTRVDMGPDNMADMVSPVAAVPASEPGVYAFKTDLPMAGRYMLSVAAKVQGEPETVVGKVIFKAVK